MEELAQVQATTAVVFGNTFSLYSDDEYEEFVEFLRRRLRSNSIDLERVFAGKRCLDAGCGGGRGSILMAECGASEVVAFDLSDANLRTTETFAARRGLNNVATVQGSVHALPFPDESFDVVWSNGVLHHTGDTDLAILEVTRVLKRGGWMWLYLYGSGGIYWHAMDWIRETLKRHSIDVQPCIDFLVLQGVPVRRIAEWIDDWFVPVLQRYTREDVAARLASLGFPDAAALAPGTEYDTSQRRIGASEREIELMGDGDVRFWCQKTADPVAGSAALADAPDGKGSHWVDAQSVHDIDPALERLGRALDDVQRATGGSIAVPILICSRVHSAVRAQLESSGEFDMDALIRECETIAAQCAALTASVS